MTIMTPSISVLKLVFHDLTQGTLFPPPSP